MICCWIQKQLERRLLEPWEAADAGGINAAIKGDGGTDTRGGGTVVRHGENHSVDEKIIDLTGEADTTKKLTLFTHTGLLNDHAPDISALQDKLSDADAKKPDLKK